MNIHYLQHVPYESLGSIKVWAKRHKHRVTSTRLFYDDPLPDLERLDWLIVMGGPMSVNDEDHYPWLIPEKHYIEQTLQKEKTVLGISLGAQLIAQVLGARVYSNFYQEIGWFPVRKTTDATHTGLLPALPAQLEVFHWHGDTFEIPAGAVHLARSKACRNQAFSYNQKVIGFQFHLESTPTDAKRLILNSFNPDLEGAYIQRPEAMLADESKFRTINTVMNNILDDLAGENHHPIKSTGSPNRGAENARTL